MECEPSKRISKIIDHLRTIAEDISPIRGARVAAAIVLKNKIVGLGSCSMKTHPFQAKFSRDEHSIHEHAEVSAIKNAIRRVGVDALSNSILIVVRRKHDQNGKWVDGCAKPCTGCQRAIEHYKIKLTIHT